VALSPSHAISLTHSLSLAHSHNLSHTHTHKHTHAHSLTLALSVALSRQGANLESVDEDGRTALFLTAMAGPTPTINTPNFKSETWELDTRAPTPRELRFPHRQGWTFPCPPASMTEN